MGGAEHRPATAAVGLDQFAHQAAAVGVKGSERLIEQPQGFVAQQQTSEPYPPLLALGELAAGNFPLVLKPNASERLPSRTRAKALVGP